MFETIIIVIGVVLFVLALLVIIIVPYGTTGESHYDNYD